MRALNRTLKGMEVDATKEITSEYLIKQYNVKGSNAKDIDSQFKKEKATMSKLYVILGSEGRPIPLKNFKTRAGRRQGKPGTKGVSAQTMKSGSMDEIGEDGRKAFIATTGKIGNGVFMRTEKSTGSMFKMKPLFGPSVSQMLDNDRIKKIIQKNAKERFQKELDHEIKYLLSQNN